MAIVQISRITNRKGETANLPQLAGAELGWCIDSRRLFIGNGTLQEGAPVIGNTEILTQFSDIPVLSTYTYQDIAVGYAADTGSTPSNPTVRTIQAKLDDFADVRDFGAVGDGVADDTAAINRALYQLYCRENNTQIRRSLFFPAGTYRVTSEIIIPTYAKLEGEGADCTTIVFIPLDSFWPTYPIQFGDSRQQTGVNIGTNGATPPRNIEISSMTFQSTEPTDIFLVDRATQGCWFSSVNFIGSLSLAEIESSGTTPLPEIAAVRFDSDGSLTCADITFDRCGFTNITYGIDTDVETQGITVSNSRFDTLLQGAVIAGDAGGFRLVHNTFDNVYSEGIVYSSALNLSAYNIFYNVGNGISAGGPISPVITFGTDTNVSANDLFSREDTDAFTWPRISIFNTGTNTGGTQLTQGHYTQENGKSFTIGNNAVNQPIFNINTNKTKAFQMQYTIVRDTGVRTGTLVVTTGPQYTNDYSENIDIGVTLLVQQTSNNVSVNYTSTSTGYTGALTYSLSYLA